MSEARRTEILEKQIDDVTNAIVASYVSIELSWYENKDAS